MTKPERAWYHIVMDRAALTTLTRSFINLVYPLHCLACKKALDPLDDYHLCDFCKGQIKINPWPDCKSLKITTVYSASRYEGVIKDLIHLFKYKRKIVMGRAFSDIMIDFLKDRDIVLRGIDMITFVPLQARRLRQREFNQSKILAVNISNRFNIPLYDLLDKIKTTRPQNELDREERLINLKNAFRIKNGAVLSDRNILLIDDVVTTGATLNECAKILLNAGAKLVKCLTLARGV